MPDFTQNPRYQRAIQRLRRLSPDQRAVFDTLALDESFADEAMRKRLRSMQLATQKEGRAKSLEFGERGLKLKEREFAFEKKQIGPATVLGAAEAGLGVYAGIQERKTAKETARSLLSLRSQYPGQATIDEDDSIFKRRSML